MSEEQPLLSGEQRPTSEDVERGGGDVDCEKGYFARCKERTAETLESRPWHYTVILLARILFLFSRVVQRIPRSLL